MLLDKTVRELLAAFASPDPTPGGGSASALASSVGAALLLMVSGMRKTRSGREEDRAALDKAHDALSNLHRQLTETIDSDSVAYDEVVAAYKLPKATEGEKADRKEAVQRAVRAATEVPLNVMRLSSAALAHATSVATHGNPAAASDVGVAVALLRAGFHGARLNVDSNLGSLSDSTYVEAVKEQTERLISSVGDDL